jgi:hypothetical protein
LAVSWLFAIALALAANSSVAVEKHRVLPCTYSSRLDKDTLTHPGCAWRDASGRIHLSPTHLRRLDFDGSGLASVHIDGFYYVRRDGRLAATMELDNWADPFVDGRARSQAHGKIGYIDRSLRLRIPARYDGAYPFDHGLAVVCRACTSRSHGEHGWYEGGVWGCIDRYGRERSAFRPLKPAETFGCGPLAAPPPH